MWWLLWEGLSGLGHISLTPPEQGVIYRDVFLPKQVLPLQDTSIQASSKSMMDLNGDVYYSTDLSD
jgi:hypothetical protein